MDIRIEFDYGPIAAEIQSDADESYDEVLTELASFIEDHEEIFGDIDVSGDGAIVETAGNGGVAETGGADSSPEVEDPGWESLVEKTDVPEEKLQLMFGIGGELPQILIGDKVTGSKNNQMEEGALMLLTVWEHYYDGEEMTVTQIRKCLENSGLPSGNFSNVYQVKTFNAHFVREQVGREDTGGKTSVIKLTPLGRKRAYSLISDLSEDVEV